MARAERRPTIRSKWWLGALLTGCAAVVSAQSVLQITTPLFPLTPVGQSVTKNVSVSVAAGSNTVIYFSISLAPGVTDFALGTITGCVIDGTTANSAGTTCTIPVTFTPTLPGNAGATIPISRAAALVISDGENGLAKQYSLGLVGSASMPRAVLVPGKISDLIGNDKTPTVGYAGDGTNTPSAAVFNNPSNMAVDNAGNVFISDTGNCIVRRIDKVTGYVSTVAGTDPSPTPNCGSGTDNTYATFSLLSSNTGIALDAAGNLYIADTGNNAVRMVSASTAYINTVAGTLNSAGFSGNPAAAAGALLNAPQGIAVDGFGNLYIADTGNYIIRMVSAANGLIKTIAGLATQQGLPATEAPGTPATGFLLGTPQAVTVDSAGNVYIADTAFSGVLEIAAATQLIQQINTVPGVPTSVNFDASDTLHYTLVGDCNVYKLPTGATSPITIAGNGTCTPSGDGGSALAAGLNHPTSVVVDGTGSLYILENDGVRFVDSTGTQPTSAAFGPTQLYTTATQNLLLFNGDIQTPAGTTANPLGVFYQGGLPLPFSVLSPATGQDCSQATSTVTIPLNPAAFCSLSMSFTPTVAGPFTGTTSLFELVGSSSAQVTQTVNLSGTGTGTGPTATLTGANSPLSAGINAGSTSILFTLTNTSTAAPLTIASITFSNLAVTAFTQTTTCTSVLSPNASCTITVSFHPTSAGTVSQTLVVADNTAAGQQSVVITGTGTAATATLTSASTTFTGIVNEGGNAIPFTLANTSTSAGLTLSSIQFSNTAYGQTNNCPAVLAPSASCIITVSFFPTATGTFTSTVTVSTDATNSPQTANLSGTATAPLASLSAASLSFGSAQYPGTTSAYQSVTLSNTGTAPLNVSSITLSGTNPEDFLLDASACPAQLAVPPATGSSCNIRIAFKPATSGSLSALIVITDDSGGQRSFSYVQQSVTVTATALPFVQTSSFSIANNSFPSIGPGSTETQTVTLTLQSTSTILKTIAVGAGFSQYTIGAITGCIVDGTTANPSGTICSIPITFSPTQASYAINVPLIVTTVESGNAVPYAFGLTGISTGAIAALTPGIISAYLSGPQVGQLGSAGLGGFNGPATSARIGYLVGQTVDGAGNLYAMDSLFNVIYKVTPAGVMTLYAGKPFTIGGYLQTLSGDGGPALSATLAYGGPLAVDSVGNLYIGDQDGFGHAAIRKIDVATNTITTVVGGGSGCTAQLDTFGDGCLGTQAMVASGVGGAVTGLAIDAAGDIYFSAASTYGASSGVATTVNYAVRKWTAATGIVSVYAGTVGQIAGTGPDGAAAIGAKVAPSAIAVDHLGNLFLIDNGKQIREISITGTITTVAGLANASSSANGCTPSLGTGDGGSALSAGFGGLTGLAVDAADNLYLVDNPACEVRRIDAGTQIIHTVAGLGSYSTAEYGNLGDPFLTTDGAATLAGLRNPLSISVDSNANLYIMGQGDVRKIDVSRSVMDFARTGLVTPVGSSTNPLTVTVVNAGNGGVLSFNAPFTNSPLYGISSGDFTRDTAATDCIATVAGLSPGFECSNNVDFTPIVAANPLTDTQFVADSAVGSPQSITLIGNSSGIGAVTLLPHLLSFFGAVNVATAAQSFTLTNNTATSIPLSSIGIVGVNAAVFSQTNNCGTSLAASGSCTIQVVFTPTALGQFLAQVGVVYTSGAVPQTLTSGMVGLSGTPAASFFQATSTINASIFGSQTVNTTSSPHNFLLQSTGTIPLTITSVTLTGTNANQFAIVANNCPALLQPTATCTISVTFSPTANSGSNPFTAQISVADNAAGAPTTVALNGTGSGNAPTILNLSEVIHVSDATSTTPSTLLNISEFIHISDTAVEIPSTVLNLNEIIHVSDAAAQTPSTLLNLSEVIHVADAATSQPGQTISFSPPLSPVLFTSGPYTLQATSSSGLPVLFSILAGPGSISGNQLNITGIGTIVIAADQPGNATYAAAPQVQRTVVVDAVPTIFRVGTGTLPQGIPSALTLITLNFVNTFKLGSLSSSTLGAPGTDFVVTTGGSCAPGNTYVAGSSCTVGVIFTPSGPGLVVGQLNAIDNLGNLQGTANLASVRFR